MSNYRLTGGSLDDAAQQAAGTGYVPTSTYLDMSSNSSTGVRYNAAIRFPGNTLAHNEAINVARLGLRFRSGNTGAHFDVLGHKVVNSPAMKATAGSGTNDVNSRLSTVTTALVTVSNSAAIDTTVPFYIDVTTIVQELVQQSSWVSGNAITFLIRPYSSPNYSTTVNSNDQTQPAFDPELYVDYGAPDPSALDLDVLIGMASHGVCSGQAGVEMDNVSVVAPGWSNQVIDRTYAGAVSSVNGTNIFGGSDQHRGYTPNGILQDSIEARFASLYGGANKVKVYRGEFAKGGTTIETWAADITKTDGTGQWDGAWSGGQESLNHRLANPKSPSKRGLFWLVPDAIVNSMFRDCASGLYAMTLTPRGSGWGSTDWSDASDMTKRRNVWAAALESIITNILAKSAAYTDLRVVIPGIRNFEVFGNSPAAYHYAPDVTGQPLERLVASTGSFGVGYPQVQYDGISSQVHAGALSAQSTYVQAAGQYQISTYGAWDTNNAFQWNASLAAVATTPLSSPRTWNHPLPSLGSTDLWKHAMRNVTDITVNQFVVGEVDAIVTRVLSLHPAWKGRVFYLPHPQPDGPDTSRSADDTSPYAQNPWTHQYEGIHPDATQFRSWVDAVVAEMDTKISFLPGFIPPSTTTVSTIAVIDPVTNAIIDPAPSSLVVGQKYQRDVQFSAVGGDLTSVYIDVDVLTSQLDGGATLRVTTVPGGATILAETAIDQGNTFTGLGTLPEGETWRARVRGTCVS